MKKMFMAVIALMMTISASAQFYIYYSDGTVAKVDSISMIAPNSSVNKGFFDGTPEERGFYTTSEAIAAVSAGMIVKNDSIKVGGIISRWFKKSSAFDKYHSVSFFVMDPVTGQEEEFEFYNCYSLDKDSFATFEYTDEKNAICFDVEGREFHLGDTVVGAGKYTIYNGTHELNTNCYLVEWRPSSSIPSAGIVDLGLSVKWATCNVGASKPEEYGDYFAWGETEPKSTYDWSTYKYCNGSALSLTKYNTKSNYGIVDNKTTLELSDDAARANWGGSWRMPTAAELTELRLQCIWTWTTQNGVNGYKVTSKSNGNSIFLPATGYRYVSSHYEAGSGGYYWSSSLDTDYFPYEAYYLGFTSISVGWGGDNTRCCGLSVRPVCP